MLRPETIGKLLDFFSKRNQIVRFGVKEKLCIREGYIEVTNGGMKRNFFSFLLKLRVVDNVRMLDQLSEININSILGFGRIFETIDS